MRIGIFFGANPMPWDIGEQIEQTVRCEEMGFDSVWFAQVANVDALTAIALAGQKAQRIELGTAVVPIYTRHPNVMGQQAATVNAAIGGRLHLGIGPSHAPAVERLGFTYDHVAQRMREYITVLRQLIETGSGEVQGQFYYMAAGFQVPGARPFPILVSALAPLMLKLAGEMTEGTITWMSGPRTLETHVVPSINAAAAAAGRPAPRVVAGIPVAVCDSVEEGRKVAAATYERYGSLTNYRRMLDREGDNLSPEDIAVCGPEAEVERRLREIASAGTTDLLASVYPVGPDTAASVERTRSLLAGLVGKI